MRRHYALRFYHQCCLASSATTEDKMVSGSDNGLEACDNILSMVNGKIPEGLVNREVTSHPGFRRKLERYREMRSQP